jgi:ethanolamine ammonia-lyase small subunit
MFYLNVLDPINQFNPATFLCLSQARTCISNVMWHGLYMFLPHFCACHKPGPVFPMSCGMVFICSCHIFVSVPSQDLYFQCHMAWSLYVPATFLCLSQARTCISNVMWHGLYMFLPHLLCLSQARTCISNVMWHGLYMFNDLRLVTLFTNSV